MEFLYPQLAGKSYYDDISGNLNYLSESSKIKAFLMSLITDMVNGTSLDDLASKYNFAKDSALYNATSYAVQVIVNIQNNNGC